MVQERTDVVVEGPVREPRQHVPQIRDTAAALGMQAVDQHADALAAQGCRRPQDDDLRADPVSARIASHHRMARKGVM